MAKEDLQYFNDLAPKYFQSRWQDKCDLVSNWPSEALAECDDQAEQEGFSDMELTYCPCFNS